MSSSTGQLSTRVVLLPRGHLAVSRDISDPYNWDVLLGYLVEVRDAGKHPAVPSPGPTTRSYPAPTSIMLGLRKDALDSGGALEVVRAVSAEGQC